MAVACQWESDIRGVPRGSCRECDCQLFQCGEGLVCARCKHPPGKHEKMLNESPITPSYSEVVSSARPRVNTGKDSWPICSNCDKRVFCDKNLGFFIYCSPNCRDEHALPEYDKKLKQDVNKIRMPIIPHPQKIIVTMETKPKAPTGFLFIPDQDKKKVAIIGAETPNAIDFFRREEVNIHDMVIEVNGTNIKEVYEIETIVSPKTFIKLVVIRDPAFNIKLGHLIEKIHGSFKKIVFLEKTYEFGIEIKEGNKLQVKNESLAYHSGLRNNDTVKCIAEATNTEIQDVHHKSFSQLLERNDHLYNLIIIVN
ncbi:PREDICTED: uncharacterized protein LOC109582767 [Amphimedon queenslandica]|uniref:PDZ domain-containing protein n=2 Tax=Amphimedon queenslandica TaxID=400682 RepID=A0AAN0J941_AMPQE|nr:PREDICTED: uncharacterized protein LOC109582767 [Amphimedon queenslandica]|eukprot:XP_019853246.1 PREDICTED: uncharacterized protein LOC109582767 [Amphimedon queenslandica]